jgi:6-pyruvoyltetrahydropterin/6-carboxytetrahydropterin synthase
MYQIRVEGSFSAAHYLRNYKGKCENMHGHNWKVHVSLTGFHLDEAGMLIDFGIVKKELKTVLETLDHKVLNDEVEFFRAHNTSAEHIARYIFEMLKGSLNHPHAKLSSVTVFETDTAACTYCED